MFFQDVHHSAGDHRRSGGGERHVAALHRGLQTALEEAQAATSAKGGNRRRERRGGGGGDRQQQRRADANSDHTEGEAGQLVEDRSRDPIHKKIPEIA